MSTRFEIGTYIRTKKVLLGRDYTEVAQQQRRPDTFGVIIEYSDSHGLCYKVQHETHCAYYDADEFIVLLPKNQT